MTRVWSVPPVRRLVCVLAIAFVTASCGSALTGPGFEASIAPGAHPQLTADDAARITRDYLDVQTTELAAPELHIAPEVTGIWAVTASAAWSVDGCIPRQASDDVVWVTKGRGDYLNLTNRPWSRSSGYADASHPEAFVCVGPGPMGTLVIDDRTGEVLGVYPTNDGYLHSPPSSHLTTPIPIIVTSPFASNEGTVVPALTVDHPTVTVSPSTHLTDGQTVAVRVTGFGVGGKVWLSECASEAVATDLGCGAELGAQPFLVTDENRAGSAWFVVRDSAFDRAVFPTPPRPPDRCADQCALVATLGSGFPYVVAPIAFSVR